MKDSFIKSVSQADMVGGGLYNDVIYLKNGMIIRISDDLIGVYKNETADTDGEVVAQADMMPETLPQELLFAIYNFSNAAQKLNEVWASSDVDGGILGDEYPFQKSFDEVADDIAAWKRKHTPA